MATAQAKAQARLAQERSQGAARRHGFQFLIGAILLVLGVAMLLWFRSGTEPASEQVDRFMHIHGLEIPPWAPDDLYIATHQGLISVDADGKWTWVGPERHDFMGFSANPHESGVFYSSGHPLPGTGLRNPVGFMVSADGGRSWSPRSLEGTADFHAMAAAPSDGKVVYGWNVSGSPGLYLSTDGGRSWETVADGTLSEAGGVLALAVRPDDPKVVWAATQEGLYSSTDGGRSWEPLMPGAVTAITFDPSDPNRAFGYAPDAGGLLESRDGGQSWSEVGLVLDADAAAHLALHPEESETLYVGTYGEDLLSTSDGGRSWMTMARSGIPQQ